MYTPLLSNYIGKRIAINEDQLDNEIIAEIKDVDAHGILLYVHKSRKPYLTGYKEGSTKYISHSTSIEFTILP